MISAQQGPLTYKVVVDGQVRQAHVDHLKISPENNAALEQPNNLQTSDLINGNHDSVSNSFLFTNFEYTDVESACNSPQPSVETFQRPHCNCGPMHHNDPVTLIVQTIHIVVWMEVCSESIGFNIIKNYVSVCS